jgi:ketosteroid isomerase-like protein
MPSLSSSAQIIAASLLFATANPSCGGSILAVSAADETALRSLVEAEKSFAATSAERGIRESFLKFFAENSIIFAPEPKNGKKFYSYYEDKGRRLTWRPIFATIASSGELGVTTGPWQLAKSKAEPAPIAFGNFLSVWRKQLDGSWKVIVDVGVDHERPGDLPAEPQLLLPTDRPARTDVDLARRALQEADRKLVDRLKETGSNATLDVASDQIHVLRQNVLPVVGREAATSLLRTERRSITRSFIDGSLSHEGDLAYRYGSYSSSDKNGSERGYYLTIWRTEAGEWKILIDLQKKTPN